MDLQRRRVIQSRSSDREAADGLLSGTLGPQDAPSEWRPVAELLTVLRTLPATTPQGGDPTADRDHRTVQAMAAILAEAPAHKAWRRHLRVPFRPSVPRPLNVFRVRLATALVAATLAFMVGLASAGRLPAPAQNAISVALSKFGITVPRAGDGEDQTTPVGPNLTGPEKKGLCTAFFAGTGNEETGKSDSNAVAFQNLQEAADKAGQSVSDFCAEVLAPASTSTTAHGHGRGHHYGQAKGHQSESGDHGSNGQSGGDHGSNGQGNGSDHTPNGHSSDNQSQSD